MPPSLHWIVSENSDALYHNVEHSMLVTLAGHDSLIGRAAATSDDGRPIMPILSWPALSTDIGYVRGIVPRGRRRSLRCRRLRVAPSALPRGASDAALAPLSCGSFQAVRSGSARLKRASRRGLGSLEAIEYTRVPYKAPSFRRRP